jgi:multiple sugar transport system permease protein
MKKHYSAGRIISYILLTAWAVLSLFPLYWLYVYAFRTVPLVIKMPPSFLPIPFTLNNFYRLLSNQIIFRWLWNTVFVSVVGTVCQVFFCTLAGYALGKRQFPGRDFIFWLIVCTLMVPQEVTLVPAYLIMSKLKWLDTYYALIVPGMAGAFGIFLMKQFLQTLPTELMESATIDGCSEFQTFTHIIMPLAKPGRAVLGIFSFMGSWNSFLWPLIMTNSSKMRLLQPGLASLQLEMYTDIGIQMAGAAISSLPMLIIFFSLQKYFLQGITVGAIKG